MQESCPGGGSYYNILRYKLPADYDLSKQETQSNYSRTFRDAWGWASAAIYATSILFLLIAVSAAPLKNARLCAPPWYVPFCAIPHCIYWCCEGPRWIRGCRLLCTTDSTILGKILKCRKKTGVSISEKAWADFLRNSQDLPTRWEAQPGPESLCFKPGIYPHTYRKPGVAAVVQCSREYRNLEMILLIECLTHRYSIFKRRLEPHEGTVRTCVWYAIGGGT